MSSSISENGHIYHFDDVTVDGENFRVRRSGQIVTLTPRAFDVLSVLIKNGGRTVEKQELFESVWKDTIVTDNALTKIIKEIRHALEDSPEKPRYIETVPKRGYRFIGEIVHDKIASNGEIANPETEARVSQISSPVIAENPPRPFFSRKALAVPAAVLIIIAGFAVWSFWRPKPADSGAPIRSIAVLPFKPLNAESRDESLEMGMAETLITRLSNVNQLVVRPISAVRKYTDPQQDPVKVGQEIWTEAVLDGSIQKAGERIRVTVRLTDVRRGTTLWSDQFDENFTDIFRVQDSIAERISSALMLRLSRQEKEGLVKHFTDDPEAYQLYLRGQLLWHGRRQNWIEQSLSYYQQALAKDPNFALAHIGAADCYIMLSGHRRLSMREAEERARPAIMRALEIDNDLAQAHNALAELKYQYEYDWRGAEKEFKTAIELNPNIAWIRQAYGWFLMTEKRFEEASVEMEKARQLDPSSLTINVGRGRLYYFSRQYEQAARHFQSIIAIEPNDRSLYLALYDVYQQSGMYAEALEAFLKFQELGGMPPAASEEFRQIFRRSGWHGFLRRRLEQMERQKAEGFRESPTSFADLYLRLGEKDKAFTMLEKVFEAREPSVLQFKIEPLYDPLRDDPRYAALLAKINQTP